MKTTSTHFSAKDVQRERQFTVHSHLFKYNATPIYKYEKNHMSSCLSETWFVYEMYIVANLLNCMSTGQTFN